MKNRILSFAAAVAVTFTMTGLSFGQATDTQLFRVIVPASVSIQAPTTATITHDETSNTNLFPAQTWIVRGNVLAGVNVSFENQTLFVHTSNSSFRRDVSLNLNLGNTTGPGAWTITQNNDSTDYQSSINTAQVTATSNGVGRAELLLTVGFVTGEFGEFAAGTYEATIIGTVAAN